MHPHHPHEKQENSTRHTNIDISFPYSNQKNPNDEPEDTPCRQRSKVKKANKQRKKPIAVITS
jgi:hypothetical protein